MGFVLYDYARARRHGQRSKYCLVGGHCQSFLVCHLHLYLTYLGTLRGIITYLSYQCPLTNFFCSFFLLFSSRWADREKGVAGMIASQVMPFGDMNVMGQWGACEAAVYQALGN